MILVEWMYLCFGVGWEGNIVCIVSVIVVIILIIGRISYFVIGGGKFLGEFIVVDVCLVLIFIIFLVLIYIVFSGFYGVVLIDLF